MVLPNTLKLLDRLMDWPLNLTLSGKVLQKMQKIKIGYYYISLKYKYADVRNQLLNSSIATEIREVINIDIMFFFEYCYFSLL